MVARYLTWLLGTQLVCFQVVDTVNQIGALIDPITESAKQDSGQLGRQVTNLFDDVITIYLMTSS